MLKSLLAKKDQLNAELERARRRLDSVEEEIEALVSHEADRVRASSGKSTGTIRFDFDGYRVSVTIPKRVQWDEVELRRIAERIRSAGDDPAKYIKNKFTVPESAFKNWPPPIKAIFEPARTMFGGKPKFAFKEVRYAG